MSRARLVRAALRAYPQGVGGARGEEMAATLMDVSGSSRRRFVRELAGLVRAGWRARAAEAASAGAPRLVADGMCLAGVWFMAVELLTLIQLRSGTMHDPLLAPGWVVLAAATIALALIGRDRLAGLGALAYMGLRLGDVMANDVSTLRLAAGLIPVACFVAMVLAPRRRGVPPGASRIGIAAAMLATNVGLAVIRVPTASSALTLLAIAAAPVTLATVVLRARRLQDSGAG